MQVRGELEAVIGLREVVSERIVLEPLQVKLLCCSQQEHHTRNTRGFFLSQSEKEKGNKNSRVWRHMRLSSPRLALASIDGTSHAG